MPFCIIILLMLVDLYIIDTHKISIEKLLNSSYIKQEDLSFLSKFKKEETYHEKLASLYLKNKYIKDYYIDENGKPISEDIYFNISHSHGVVVLGLNKESPIGIDIEQNKEIKDSLIRFTCNDEEYDYIKTNKDFLSIWTNKESLLKCMGTGINKRLNEVPGLPLNSQRMYLDDIYSSQTLFYQDDIISITIKGKKDFVIKIKEVIP